jgi:hypothetical protein
MTYKSFPKLNTEAFVFDNYCSDFWSRFEISWVDTLDNEKYFKILTKYAMGWTDGDKLLVRPKEDSKAVLFIVNDESFWFHIDNYSFYKYFKEIMV